jgi:peptide chain release factor 1
MTLYIEIRAAEGGADARGLVREMVGIYAKAAARSGFSGEIVDDRPAQVTLEFSDPKAEKLFKNESGGHRWQHTSPTDKNGRTHTSTITVALLGAPAEAPKVREENLEEVLYRKASGNGGQNNNKTATAVRLTHVPTGIKVECCSERSQKSNRETARALMRVRVYEATQGEADAKRAESRKQQVGTGQRGDKIRTYREQDNRVTDHRTGKKTTFEKIRRGELELLE